MHSSGWKPEFDPAGKRIATIGNGASGIQITTEIRKTAAHVDHYARSRTWIAGSFQPNAKERQDTPMYIDEAVKKSFEDPQAYLEYRKALESTFWRAFGAQIADSEETQTTKDNFTELMRKRLVEDPSLLEKLVPDFPPHCKYCLTACFGWEGLWLTCGCKQASHTRSWLSGSTHQTKFGVHPDSNQAVH